MSSKVQPMNAIAPIENQKAVTSSDPVQKEYEEGKKFLENNEHGQAAVCLHNALVGFEEKKDESGIANASNQLGHLCLARKDYEKALNHYQRAFEICDKSNDRMSIIAVLHKVVQAHKGLKQYQDAIDSSLDLLDHYHDNRDPGGTVQTLEVMAEIYVEDGQKEQAADAYRTISSIHKNFKHDKMAAQFAEKASELVS